MTSAPTRQPPPAPPTLSAEPAAPTRKLPAEDGRLARGSRTRLAVLDAAVALATEHSLGGLSFGQLAEHLSVSKSGLFAHWRSKEELQLAVVDHAQEQWITRVVSPALAAPRGVRRLFALHVCRLEFYAAPDALPGACFFAKADFEYNARPGVVQDRLVRSFEEWFALLERLAREAITLGELRPEADPQQLAYEIEALGIAPVMQTRLIPGHTETFARARRAVLERLRSLSTDPTLLPEA